MFVNLSQAGLSGFHVMLLCAFTGIACSLMRETKGTHLKDA
ncbi:hypothetical protein ACFY00_23765 [Kitasatospora sp. NPDC001540]